jgi:hypothetical protein
MRQRLSCQELMRFVHAVDTIDAVTQKNATEDNLYIDNHWRWGRPGVLGLLHLRGILNGQNAH